MTQMANYTLSIEADSGYSSTTEGRCTAEQYGDAIAALHGTDPKREPLTDEQIEREWQFAHDEEGNIDHHDFARAIEAAHGIKGEA
jgi:hypothetical protein